MRYVHGQIHLWPYVTCAVFGINMAENRNCLILVRYSNIDC
jgi:hypothetical protein